MYEPVCKYSVSFTSDAATTIFQVTAIDSHVGVVRKKTKHFPTMD